MFLSCLLTRDLGSVHVSATGERLFDTFAGVWTCITHIRNQFVSFQHGAVAIYLHVCEQTKNTLLGETEGAESGLSPVCVFVVVGVCPTINNLPRGYICGRTYREGTTHTLLMLDSLPGPGQLGPGKLASAAHVTRRNNRWLLLLLQEISRDGGTFVCCR
jgi:hypothetical protein